MSSPIGWTGTSFAAFPADHMNTGEYVITNWLGMIDKLGERKKDIRAAYDMVRKLFVGSNEL